MKLFNKICQFLLLFMGLVLLLMPVAWFPGFYDVRFMSVWMFVGAATIQFLPKIIPIRKAKNAKRITELFGFALAVAILGDALGSLGFYELYKYGFSYDKILHFGVPLIMVLVLAIIFEEGYAMSRVRATILAVVLVIVCAIDWELFEMVCDQVFNTHLTGLFHTDIYNDTRLDLIYDFSGSILGGLILILRKKVYTVIETKLKYA